MREGRHRFSRSCRWWSRASPRGLGQSPLPTPPLGLGRRRWILSSASCVQGLCSAGGPAAPQPSQLPWVTHGGGSPVLIPPLFLTDVTTY